MSVLKIYAPINGNLIEIENVADPVFSEKMLGDGIAIRPALQRSTIHAPCSGKITTIHDSHHAISLTTAQGIEVLIHVGIDTVNLLGEGFQPLVKIGDLVKQGQPLLNVDFPLLAKKAPSIDVILVFTNLQETQTLQKTTKTNINVNDEIINIIDNPAGGTDTNSNSSTNTSSATANATTNAATNKANPKAENLSASVVTEVNSVNNITSATIAAPATVTATQPTTTSQKVTVVNKTGFHARPAAEIVKLANNFQANIFLKKNGKQANAKSVIAILGLGIQCGETIEVIAEGIDAKTAVAQLVADIAAGLGEEVGAPPKVDHATINLPNNQTKPTKAQPTYNFAKLTELQGTVASPGFTIGKTLLLEEEVITVMENSINSPETELTTLKEALSKTKGNLKQEILESTKQKHKTKTEVLQAHLAILDDVSLLEAAKVEINKGKTDMFAWKIAIEQAIDTLKNTGNRLLIERIADFKDVYARVIKTILDIPNLENINFPPNTILVAKDLIPSDLSKLNANVKGIVLGLGSSTSHVSLMLRNMGIPTLVALGEEVVNIPDHLDVVLNGNTGKLIVNPTKEQLADFTKTQAELEVIKQANINHTKEPAITKDGVTITVKGNVSNASQVKEAKELGAEGVGLLRTEFLFLNSLKAPSTEEQLALYQASLDALEGGTLTLRTLDVGGDKPLSYIEIPAEENPIMGLRGVRNYINTANNKEIFLNQIRAILQIKPAILCRIMIPMISSLAEIHMVKELIYNEANALNINIKDKIKIGIMVEVPAAALMAESFAPHVDFFSIGTNDLAQYTMAMDRGNPQLAKQLNNFNPALLKLIKLTNDAGVKHNIVTAVCGAMASELKAIPLLIGLGIRELSTSMKSIPDVRALIRTLDSKKCITVAERALQLSSSTAIKELVKQEFDL
ncbi:phosphoenolpyruvate--protein phosphotransferase [Candidatus Hepatincola sp. Pdp]